MAMLHSAIISKAHIAKMRIIAAHFLIYRDKLVGDIRRNRNLFRQLWIDHEMGSIAISRQSKAGTAPISLVSMVSVEISRKSLYLFLLALILSISDAAQTVVSDLRASDSKPLCTTEQPLYADRDGKPIWLNTDSLLKSATHCKAPKMPAFARQARIEGNVSVDILVNDKGTVSCAKLVSGHPLLASSAINAASDWKFRPKKRDGKAVWFYGHLRFYFSTEGTKKNENS